MALPDKARAFLAEHRFAVLATINADGTPQLTTMWYELQGDEIMMNTADGRVKASNLRRDARASVLVEDGYRSVTMPGTARLVDDPEAALADARRLAVLNNGPEAGNALADNVFAKQKRLTIRVPIERIVLYGFEE